MEPSTVAGWREFRDHPLPCVGLTEVTQDFVPFTGRFRPAPPPTSPLAAPAGAAGGHVDTTQPAAASLPSSPQQQQQQRQQQQERQQQQQLHQQQQQHIASEQSSPEVQSPQSVSPGRAIPVPLRSDRCLPVPSTLDDLASSLENLHNPEQLQQQQQQQQQRQQARRCVPLRISIHSPATSLQSQSPSQDCVLLHRGLKNIFSPTRSGRNSPAFNHLDVPDSFFFSSGPVSPAFPNLANSLNNTPPDSPSSPHAMTSPSSSSSLFSISSQDASSLVRLQQKDDDSRHCYFLHVTLRPLFSEDVIPGASLRKIPRLVNGIPLGAGFLSRDQLSGIRWRLVEGGHSTLTFISCPLHRDEAEESKTALRDRLVKQAQPVFGDMTIKARVVLSRCIDYEDDFVINDIAVNLEEGLHFRD